MIPNVNAVSYHTYGVTQKEQQLIQKEKEEDRSLSQELEYRFLYKNTYDSVDYIILCSIIVLMLLIIVLLNQKTYVVFSEQSVFEEGNEED